MPDHQGAHPFPTSYVQHTAALGELRATMEAQAKQQVLEAVAEQRRLRQAAAVELEAAVTKRTADAMEGAVAAARQEGIETGRQQAALEAAALTDMKHGSMQDAAVQANATPKCTEW